MRILLQQIESGLYYSETGAWSPDCAEAREFLDSTAAVEICLAEKLVGIQLVLKFPEEKHEIVIPVLPIQASGVPGQDVPRRTR